MQFFPLLPIFIGLLYLAFIIGFIYLIYTWVKKSFSLRQEQNDLLREILKKMDRQQ